MKEEEILAVLRLQNTNLVGDILVKKLIATVGSAAEVYREKKYLLHKINGIGKSTIEQIFDPSTLRKAQIELEHINKNKTKFRYFLNDDYPKNLQHCIDAPILLFEDGNIDLSNQRIISIVGTRNMTRYGREFCEQFIEDLVPYNPIIVSGFAYGVDICAHKSAISNSLQTIAVLAHGFDHIYPKIHKKYIHMVNANGGFFTEFFHDESPYRENFLKRNRVVAGLSQATIIIESAEKGGSLVTADIANSYNRDVFAVPGRVSDSLSKGCNDLIRNHRAHLLHSAEDIVKHLNWDLPNKKTSLQKVIQKQLFFDLSSEEEKICNYLRDHGQQMLDMIAVETDIPVRQMATLLLNLELNGIIRPLPGKVFELV